MLDFRVLGPVEVWRDGQRVPLEAARERAVLAALLLQANQVVTADRLIELVWGDQPPAKARSTLHTWVWRLRRRLEPPALFVTRPPGYLVHIEADQLDLSRFERLLEQGRKALAAGRVEPAAQLLGEAVGLWRGEPLADVAAVGLAPLEGPRLTELRLQAIDAWVEAELRLGRHGTLIGELRALVDEQPLRERLAEHLMLALYRCGRQAEALQVYRGVQRVLADELGVEPGPALQRLHRAVLKADPALDLAPPAAPPTEPEPRAKAGASSVTTGSPAGTGQRPAQLPLDVAGFAGRTADVARLDRLLATDQPPTAVIIAAITGTAGVGKTALALHWAHRIRDRFGDGQLHVNLRGYATASPMRPIEALSRFLRSFGVPAQQVPLDVEEAADLYRTMLADKQVLIVLDNAHSAEQVRPLLPGSPGCLVIVTSRDRLGGLIARDGAHRFTLDVLSPEDAHSLFVCLLGHDRVHAQQDAVADLGRLCAYLPLALRIAAAALTDSPHRTIANYVSELSDGNQLAALAVQGDEHSGVRATLDLSYAALAPEARRLFGLLGLVPGPDVAADAAGALADITTKQARALLDRIAGAHLLAEHTPGRYAFHDLLRAYAAEHARTEPDRHAAIERLYNWYLHGVDAAARLLYPQKLRLSAPLADIQAPPSFDDHAGALAWLDTERANLVIAIRQASQHGQREAAWLLGDGLRSYFLLRRCFVDWLAAARAGLAAAEAAGDARAQAATHFSFGNAYLCRGQYPRAIEYYTVARGLMQRAGWLDGEAGTLTNLGTAYREAGRLARAAEHYEQALAINQERGRLLGAALTHVHLGLVCHELGQLRKAVEHHTTGLALQRQAGHRHETPADLGKLAETYHALGRLDDAVNHLTDALRAHRELGYRAAEAENLRVLAEVHRDCGRSQEARETASAALSLARETGDRRHETDALNTLAGVYRQLARADLAIEHHGSALRLAQEIGARYPEVVSLVGLARAYHDAGRLDEARGHADDALALAHHAGYRVLEGQARTALADIHRALNQPHRAVKYARQALRIHSDTGYRLGRAHALLVLGNALHQMGDATAASHWRTALALFTEMGAPEAAYVRNLLDAGAGVASGLR